MALITCPECGEQISEFAVSCPNCGFQKKEQKKRGFHDSFFEDSEEHGFHDSFFEHSNPLNREIILKKEKEDHNSPDSFKNSRSLKSLAKRKGGRKLIIQVGIVVIVFIILIIISFIKGTTDVPTFSNENSKDLSKSSRNIPATPYLEKRDDAGYGQNIMKQKFKSEIFAYVDKDYKTYNFNIVTYHIFDFEKKTILIESHEEYGLKYYHFKILSSTRTGDVFKIEVTSSELPSINEVSFNPNLAFLFYSGKNETFTYGTLTKIN